MKAIFGLLGLIVLLGLVYGLAFFGMIPVQKLADKTPALAPALISLHLAKRKLPPPVPAPGTTALADPQRQALEAEKKQIEADRAQLDKDRLAWEAQKQQVPPPGAGIAPSPADTAAKLNAIYATMSPDDIARICAKLPDPDVIAALTQLDEKKAGKILAALPDARAARLTRLMSRPALANAVSAAPLPRTSL